MMKIKLLQVVFLSTMMLQNLSAQTYCASKGNHPWNEWIAKVQFGTIPNFMGANWNAIQPFEVIQYDSAGHKTVCSTRLKFVPDCATTPVTPVFNSCPTNLTVSIPSGQTCGIAKWAQPTLERYMKTALSSNFASGHCFPLGTTTVIYTAKDSCNHTATCSFTVTVKHAVAISGQANAFVTPLNARVYDNKVKLDWVQLSSEAATFEVQKPTEDGFNFKTIHQIVAQPTDGYHWGYDELPEEGANDYRLKTVLKSGKEIYSPIERVDYQKLPDFTVFPNPTHEETFVDLKNFVNQKVELSISDLAGKVLLKQTIEHVSILPHRVDVSKLQNGAYLLEIQTVGKRTLTRQVHILK
jgi:Secretion system C-terminal sorting domain/HYR domain